MERLEPRRCAILKTRRELELVGALGVLGRLDEAERVTEEGGEPVGRLRLHTRGGILSARKAADKVSRVNPTTGPEPSGKYSATYNRRRECRG